MSFSYEVLQQCLCHIVHHDVSLNEPLLFTAAIGNVSHSLENMFTPFQTQFLVNTFGKLRYKSKFKLIQTYSNRLGSFHYRLFKGINKEEIANSMLL